MSVRELVARLSGKGEGELIVEVVMKVIAKLLVGAVLVFVLLILCDGKHIVWSIIAGLLLFLSLVVQSLLPAVRRYFRSKALSEIILNELKSIPQENDDESWRAWVNQMVALLRGMGLLRKSQALRESLECLPPNGRACAAEKFLLGIIHEESFSTP